MTLFALTPASSRGAGQRQIETRFRISRSKGRSLSVVLTLQDNGECVASLWANSREWFGTFTADATVSLLDKAGNVVFQTTTPEVRTVNAFARCVVRGRLAHKFSVEPSVLEKVDKVRLTSGRDEPAEDE